MLLCANLKCTKGENCGRKWFDPRRRPGNATTCSPECTKELEVEKRKERWKRLGPKRNAELREQRKPIIKRLPLGTLVRERWTRAPNMVLCDHLKCTKGEDGGRAWFDGKKGAIFCSGDCRKEYKKGYAREYKRNWVEYIPKSPAKKPCEFRGELAVVMNLPDCDVCFDALDASKYCCPEHKHQGRMAKQRIRVANNLEKVRKYHAAYRKKIKAQRCARRRQDRAAEGLIT
jgi:hypothetical protein